MVRGSVVSSELRELPCHCKMPCQTPPPITLSFLTILNLSTPSIVKPSHPTNAPQSRVALKPCEPFLCQLAGPRDLASAIAARIAAPETLSTVRRRCVPDDGEKDGMRRKTIGFSRWRTSGAPLEIGRCSMGKTGPAAHACHRRARSSFERQRTEIGGVVLGSFG